MNDPWDVKSVRRSENYLSHMKINGVPLLPPILSTECRKEMQYYKILAKEVEKRLDFLKIIKDATQTDDDTDTTELQKSEVNGDKAKESQLKKGIENKKHSSFIDCSIDKPLRDVNHTRRKSLDRNFVKAPDTTLRNQKGTSDLKNNTKAKKSPDKNLHKERVEIPEKEDTKLNKQRSKNHQKSPDVPKLSNNHDGSSPLSSKGFTGSLNNLYSQGLKDSITTPTLIRQRSYTVLKPSPQLLDYLEGQSTCKGVDVTSISMSESIFMPHTPSKKRRSWDLESAKMKWSSLALELKSVSSKASHILKKSDEKTAQSQSPQPCPVASRLFNEKPKDESVISKTQPKSEPIPSKTSFETVTPIDKIIIGDVTADPGNKKKIVTDSPKKNPIVTDIEDPATKIRDLYERIQNQQLMQMTNLVEKQKREQMLLQQVFEEQNNILYKQLKTIAPKSVLEVKEAWTEKVVSPPRGLVSLSQLIDSKPPKENLTNSPSNTINASKYCINKCDTILKKSRDITSKIKNHMSKPMCRPKLPVTPSSPSFITFPTSPPSPSSSCFSRTPTSPKSPQSPTSSTKSRSSSPILKFTSRKLKYDATASTQQDFDLTSTPRTNDTMADLNVTLPTDRSDGSKFDTSPNIDEQNLTLIQHSPKSVKSTITMEDAVRNLDVTPNWKSEFIATKTRQNSPEDTKQLSSASIIVAYAKGYLVRRLMQTEKVQGIVQTIRDALLCALQLHQEREGIRGADVDLHRRLIQQITAACYTLHDTFITSTPAERCAIISADRARKQMLDTKAGNTKNRPTDI